MDDGKTKKSAFILIKGAYDPVSTNDVLVDSELKRNLSQFLDISFIDIYYDESHLPDSLNKGAQIVVDNS